MRVQAYRKDSFIIDIASFLPNKPVENDRMEEILGMVGNLPSRTKKIVLRNNGIKQRYYAIDPDTGEFTHTNAQLTAAAISRLAPWTNFSLDQIDLLCCGTSSPDQFMPGHGPMVHGELGNHPLEVVSTAGICLAGISSLKYATLAIASGAARNAVATGSEMASIFLRTTICNKTGVDRGAELVQSPGLSFEADFLRWMLSDGAGACLISGEKSTGKPALRIDWIDIISQANRLEPCMYAGAIKQEGGNLKGWLYFSSLTEAIEAEAFYVKQDAKLLHREIIPVITRDTLLPIIQKYDLRTDKIDWFLPHYSSEYFRQKLYAGLQEIGFEIGYDRWFTNLTNKGNTGSASIYIMLEELFKSGNISRGDSILCMIPESGRFSCGYMHLTVV